MGKKPKKGPGNMEDRTKGENRSRKGLTAALLFALALVLCAVAALLFTLRVGSRLYLCVDTVDLRGAEISCAEYDDARARRPEAVLRWSVPIGDERFDSFSESIALSSLPADGIDALAYFPNLKTVDARACRDYESLAAAPELGGHDDGAAAEPHADELEDGVKLVGQRRSGDLRLAEGAHHDVV